jgi:predicted MFS family arabinose efflux permease
VESEKSSAVPSDRASEESRLVLVLFALLALGNVDSQIFAPLLPEIARGLDTTVSWVGRAVSGYAVAAAAAALVAGPLSDRLGRRVFLAGAAAILALASAAAALASSFYLFALARIAAGAGAGIISALSIAAIADAVPYERRGRSMGWVATAYTGAPIFGIPMALWIAASPGWRANYALFAIAGALLGVAVHSWLRESSRSPSGQTRPRSYRSFLANRATALGAISAFFVTGGVTGFLLFLSAYLQRERGLSLSQIAFVFLFSGIASLAGAFGAGRLSDRVGKSRITLGASLSLVLLLLLIPWLEGPILYVVIGLAGLSVAARLAPLQSIVTELVPMESRGAYVALRNTISQCGNAAAAIAAGSLYESGFHLVCYFAAGFSAAAFLLLFWIPEPR